MSDMRRRKFITPLGGAAVAWRLKARAQPQHRHFRIGWLVFGGAALGVVDRTLLDALQERGSIDARNTEVIFRYANGVPTQLGELAAGLVADRPDVLIGVGGDVVKALFDASKGGIPIVGGVSDDPSARGLPYL
jgi:putative ABC transport system substrate-binding protein